MCSGGKARRHAHLLVPAVGDGGQWSVEVGAQVGDVGGQRRRKILVLAAPETMPGHNDVGAEQGFAGIKRGQGAAGLRPQ